MTQAGVLQQQVLCYLWADLARREQAEHERAASDPEYVPKDPRGPHLTNTAAAIWNHLCAQAQKAGTRRPVYASAWRALNRMCASGLLYSVEPTPEARQKRANNAGHFLPTQTWREAFADYVREVRTTMDRQFGGSCLVLFVRTMCAQENTPQARRLLSVLDHYFQGVT